MGTVMTRFLKIAREIEQDYEVVLDLCDIHDVFVTAQYAVQDRTGYVGIYHVWENGYERGDAYDNEIIRDAIHTGVVRGNVNPQTGEPWKAEEVEDKLIAFLDEEFEAEFRSQLEALATECRRQALERAIITGQNKRIEQ